MSCSVSRPVSCPSYLYQPESEGNAPMYLYQPESFLRTRADTGARGMIQGVIQNKTCTNLCITYIQQKAVSYMQLGTYKDKIRRDKLYVYSSLNSETDKVPCPG